MPREHKKRGRRGDKRKHDHVDDSPDAHSSKRRKSMNDHDAPDDEPTAAAKHSHVAAAMHDPDGLDAAYPATERPFFGMLDDEEQEYFRRADDMLESNSFADQEERDLFLTNVYKEADGKELKIAQSQSCSRLMERLIRLSSPQQLKNLFSKFSGSFIHLVTHRFASHCCEALFLRAAPIVTQELVDPSQIGNGLSADTLYVSMEDLFLHTLAEFSGQVGYLFTDRYASHVLRILLLILSGEPLESTSTKQLLRGKSKEHVTVQGAEEPTMKILERPRSVPDAFSKALETLISESIAGLDTDKLRTLAIHPHGSPSLQLLLKLELSHFGKQRAKDETSIIRTLLPDVPITEESGSASFIKGIVYDQTGSHLVEQIVKYAPAKMFKSLYREFFKERLTSFARNEVAGYVTCQVLERLGKDDLLEVHELFIPALAGLLERNRTIAVRKLIERCAVRDVDTRAIAAKLDSIYSTPDGFDIKKLLRWDQPEEPNGSSPQDSAQSMPDSDPAHGKRSDGARSHFSLLAQSMLSVPGPLSALILEALVKVDSTSVLAMAKDYAVSRTVQYALTTPHANMIQRRKMIQHFYGHIGDMALDKSASHVVDCIWEGTHGLAFIRERIAEELAENEGSLRNSPYGRAIWRNWKMDIYKRRRADWIRQSKNKASNDGFQSFSESEMNKKETPGKSAIDIARERHAKAKAAKEEEGRDSVKSKAKSSRSSKSAETASSGKMAPTATASG